MPISLPQMPEGQRNTVKYFEHLKVQYKLLLLLFVREPAARFHNIYNIYTPWRENPCAGAGELCIHPVSAEAFHLLRLCNVAISSSITGPFLQVPVREFVGIGKEHLSSLAAPHPAKLQVFNISITQDPMLCK